MNWPERNESRLDPRRPLRCGAAWPLLPEAIRRAITAMVEATGEAQQQEKQGQ